LDKEMQWKALWRSGAVALGLLVILFLSKSMFSFQELMMDTIVKVMDLDLLRRLKETG
jgi:hypothetical protein